MITVGALPGVAQGVRRPYPQDMPDAQKVLERLRKICLSLPETAEVEAWGHPTFRVRNKIFASMGETTEGELSIGFKTTVPEQQVLIEDPRFSVAAYVGKHGWVSMRVAGRLRWKEIDAHIRHSFRLIAPKALAAQVED